MGGKQHIAVYPGSFDPVTLGHLEVIRRGRRLFDRVVIGVGHNPDKQTLFTERERVAMVREQARKIVDAEPNEAPIDVEAYTGLTVDFAVEKGATALLKGIRNLSDLNNEIQQAVTNREVANIETAFVVAGQSFAYISSTLIRQITAMGKDLSVLATMCPPEVIAALERKKTSMPPALSRMVEE
ncbi:MAG: pantetheine-phosphate adenylyltransferase [Phycisphaerales bacterium]